MSCQPSFAQFLETDAGRKACDPQFIDRLGHADVQIKSLTQLLKFANERWPEHYPADSRKDPALFLLRPLNGEAMRRLWGEYLRWKETPPERRLSPVPKAVAS